MSEHEVKGYLASNEKELAIYTAQKLALHETFKGEVNDTQVTFPKELGAEHPFDYEQIERVVDKIGLANSAVEKMTDSIIGDFSVETDEEKAQILLDDFIKDTSFITHVRPWIKEAVAKGSGFMDLSDMKNSSLQSLNSNGMYVKRNKKGEVLGYNQYIGNTKKITINKKTVIPFGKNEIAQLDINKNPGSPYGLGYIHPNLRVLENYASSELDSHKVASRKAGSPMHVKVGIPGQSTSSKAIDEVNDKLKYMNNCTEWATDANVDIKMIDFGQVGESLTKLSMHDVEQFSIGTQIPMVLLGVANVPEGLAKVNMEMYQRFISSIREIVEDVIEHKILKPFLRTQGFDADIKFTWEMPGEEEKNQRILRISELIKNPFISPALKAALEEQLAQIMDLDVIDILDTPEEAMENAEKQAEEDKKKEEEMIKQPEVPGEKPTAQNPRPPKPKVEPKAAQNELIEEKTEDLHVKEGAHFCSETCTCGLSESEAREMTLAEYVNITEIAGFNYTDYLVKILQKLKTYKFSDLLALTEQDLLEGLLPETDIDKLRLVLKDGFQKNKTIRQIEKEIETSIDLKDRVKFNEDGTKQITLAAKLRPLVIARTETVRLANAGLKDLYQENDITSYRYLSALDDRTSEICRELNGKVFLTQDGTPGVNMPPMHVRCRSTIVGLVE